MWSRRVDRTRLAELADRVEIEHDRVLVTRNGRPSFVLINADELESLEETIDILGDPEMRASIATSVEESERGVRYKMADGIEHIRPPED